MKYLKPVLVSFSVQTNAGYCTPGTVATGWGRDEYCNTGTAGGVPPAHCNPGTGDAAQWEGTCQGGNYAISGGGDPGVCDAGPLVGGWANPCNSGEGA